jgi:predicted DNA binding CopG/RHH family protein
MGGAGSGRKCRQNAEKNAEMPSINDIRVIRFQLSELEVSILKEEAQKRGIGYHVLMRDIIRRYIEQRIIFRKL